MWCCCLRALAHARSSDFKGDVLRCPGRDTRDQAVNTHSFNHQLCRYSTQSKEKCVGIQALVSHYYSLSPLTFNLFELSLSRFLLKVLAYGCCRCKKKLNLRKERTRWLIFLIHLQANEALVVDVLSLSVCMLMNAWIKRGGDYRCDWIHLWVGFWSL